MIENLPIWINITFLVAVFATLVFFRLSNKKSKKALLIIIIWSIIHSALAYFNFYTDNTATPPRFGLVLIPATILIIYSLTGTRKKRAIENRKIKYSTFLHIVRIPVEIVLWGLFAESMVPELMTFEDRNFDILAGISSPIVGLLYLRGVIGNKSLLLWNYIGLFLVTFIAVNGILSAELPFQQFAFEQPNRALAYFPFVLLPALIVPIVIWTHISDIMKLKAEIKANK